MNTMEIKHFNDYESFALYLIQQHKKMNQGEDISIIAKYYDASEIIAALVSIGYYKLMSIDLDFEVEKEFIISLLEDGIWCEPMFRDNGYLKNDSTVAYVLDNCSSEVISYCESEKVYEVNIDEEDYYADENDIDCDEEYCDYCGCKCHKDNDDEYEEDDTNLSSNVYSTYKIDGKRVSEKEFRKKEKEFESRFCDEFTKSSRKKTYLPEIIDWYFSW